MLKRQRELRWVRGSAEEYIEDGLWAWCIE